MRKIYARLLLTAVVLLPTLFAVLTFMNAHTKPLETASVISLELTDPDGTVYSFDAQNEADAEFIQFMVELGEHALSIEKLPADLEGSSGYTAIFVSRAHTRQYRYYFSPTKPSSSYLVDYAGNAFRIDAADTIAFLDSAYSSALYSHSQSPILTAAGNVIEPSYAKWSYYSYSNVEHISTVTSEQTQTVTSSYASFAITFDTLPDKSTLKITDDDGNTLYEGSYNDFIKENHLKKLIRKDMLLHIDLSAHWEKSMSISYFGDAAYHFELQVIFDPGATFWLGEETVELGDFVVLSGKYVEYPEELSFSSEPSIDYEPIFFVDGEYVRALIPIAQNLPDGARDYQLKVNYLGIEHSLTLQVNPTDYVSTVKSFNRNGSMNLSARTEATLAAFSEYIASLPYEPQALFNGAFIMDSGHGKRAEYGNTVNNGDADDRFVSNGLSIVSYAGTKLHAINNGKVIAVGKTALGGNTVVIDHGLGLRSVYYCIGTVNVQVGDMVTVDTVIGSGADSSGYSDGITAHCELWVGNKAVSYYQLTEEGRNGMVVYGDITE